MGLRDIQEKEKKEKTQKALKIILTISLALILSAIPYVYIFSQKIEEAENENRQFLKTIRAKLASGNITDIEDEDIEKFIGLAKSRRDVNAFWRTCHEQLDIALRNRSDLNKSRLDILKRFRAIVSQMPNPKPDWWAKNQYESRLDSEIQFLELWENSTAQIANEKNLRKRLKHIRGLLHSNPHINDPKYALISRKFLAETVIRSTLELEDNPSAEGLLTAVMPEVQDYSGIALPLSLIYEQLKEYKATLGAYYSAREIVQSRLKKIEEKAKSRSFIMRKVLREISEGLEKSEQGRLTQHILLTLREKYLFELGGEAWPPGVQPLPKVLEVSYERNKKFSDMARIFSQRPVYRTELQTLLALVSVRCYQYEAVAVFKNFTELMGDDIEIDLSLLDELESKIPGLMPPKESYLRGTRAYFSKQGDALFRMKMLLSRWNKSEDEYERGRILREAKDFLSQHCSATRRPGDGDCVDLGS